MVNYFQFGFRNLRRRGIRSWLTLLGIFIGIVAVITLISLGNGLKAAVNAQFGVASTQIITVQASGVTYGPPGSSVVNPLTVEDARAIEKISSVDFVIERNIETLKIEYNDVLQVGYAVSVIEGMESELYEAEDISMEKGRLLDNNNFGKVMIGYSFSKDDNQFGKAVEVGKKINLQGEDFEVIGIVEKKGSFILDSVIWMYDDDLNSLMDYGDEVDIIAVKIKDKNLMDQTKEEIERLLRDRRNVDIGEEDFEVSTPESSLQQVNQILTGVQIFIIIIASISIVVGAIGIVNTMTTSVLERKKEIGIMKAIGAKNSHIFYQFLVESGLLGFVGGLAGVIAGVILGYAGTTAVNNFIGSTAPPAINLPLIFSALIGSFVIGAAAGIIPALRAANQNPVEALRG